MKEVDCRRPSPRVLLAMEYGRAYGRECALGVAAWARLRGDWTFVHADREAVESPPTDLASIRVDGVIARLHDKSIVDVIRFSAALGRSPRAEILRVRMERAKRLLL